MDNYVRVQGYNPFRFEFFFLDRAGDHAANDIFKLHKIKVNLKNEFVSDNNVYGLVHCSIRKPDLDEFKKCMEQLKHRLLLSGYKDYNEWCKKLFDNA